ncbi:MAG: heme biosynthesis HemY N-terminal domain-containing protein [Alphaproteobacteria bacterium]
MASFIRAILVLVLLAGAIFLIQNAAQEPGAVTFTWQGYTIDTSATFFIAVFNIALILAFYGGRLAAFLISIPERFRHGFVRRQDRHALALISRGMEALAAGDTAEQRKVARLVQKSLPDAALGAALAAHLDPTPERLHLMLGRPDTSFTGHSGLLNDAVKRGDWVAAKFHAAGALKKRPDSPAVQHASFNALMHTGDFDKALELIPSLNRRDVFGDKAPVVEAAVRLHAAMHQVADNPNAALRQAQNAESICLHFTPAALFRASTLVGLGKTSPAERALAAFWHTCPRFDVFQKWFDVLQQVYPDLPADKLLKKAEQLVAEKLTNADDGAVSSLCLGVAALKLGLLDDARKQLTLSFRKSVNREVLVQLAQLERKAGDEHAAADWLQQALDAQPLHQMGDNVLTAYQDFRRTYGLDHAKGHLSRGADSKVALLR